MLTDVDQDHEVPESPTRSFGENPGLATVRNNGVVDVSLSLTGTAI
jgi:hypothetical protein